ncbi:sialidase family protein [Paraflavitalea devenefica]|uniref:sialidase family protein n=1 Tax=Paraflavitalea devenefica TaxID=2716334 RepID=UPI00293C1208|nr:sialidase family protein [Paraflavitalea devenefica]
MAGSYASMRIPALVLTKQGTLLAFCEGRVGTASDWAEMDMLMRRSTDGGKTWEPMVVIAPRQGMMPTSNATPIVDANGTIHLLYQRGYANAYYTKSADDGKTWSPAVDITYAFEAFKPEYNWQVLAPGPGHSIQLINGRLLVPVWICDPAKLTPHKSHYPSRVATIYSDDTGRTWKRGAILPDTGIKNPSETMAVQLEDGRVMLNIRHSGDSHRRGVSYSPDGISGWTVPVLDTALYEPVCMASIIRVNDKGRSALLFSNPDTRLAPKPPRKNLTVKLSYDDGQNWPIQQVIDTSFAGYSDLAVDKEGTVYCLYETNTVGQGWNYSLVLKRFTVDWIKKRKK